MLFDFLPPDRERVAFRHALHVDCQVVRERDFKLVGRRTLDISTTGVQVIADLDDLAIGEDCRSFRGRALQPLHPPCSPPGSRSAAAHLPERADAGRKPSLVRGAGAPKGIRTPDLHLERVAS